MSGRKCHKLKVWGEGRVCKVSLGQRGGSSYEKDGREWEACSPAISQILGPPFSDFADI